MKSNLTSRENEILQALVDYESIEAAANKLCIAQTTAKTHLNNIREKLFQGDGGNLFQVVIRAVKLGLVNVRAEEPRQ